MQEIGIYKLEAKIGEGGMGVVYRALDTELDRPVAIKLLQQDANGSNGDESAARFMREAKAASRLQHPSIMTIHQFGLHENTRYLVMEFIEGKTLKKLISNSPMPIRETVEIAIQVADALSVAHEKGVIHRDLKAENIMITPRGQAKVLDFGLAKIAEPAGNQDATVDDFYKTTAGTILGTVTNMSPEQALGRDVDALSDMFSFGVVLYEMVTGKSPYLAPTAQSTIARILTHEPELVSELNPGVPPDLERIIHLCLRKEASQRPSAKLLTTELKKVLTSLSARELAGIQSQSGSGIVASVQVPSSAHAVPGTEIKPPSSMSIKPASSITAPNASPDQLKKVYWTLKGIRIAIGLVTLLVPAAMFFYMVVGAGVIRTQFVDGTTLWNATQAIVVPVLTLAEKVFTFRPVVNGWNLMLLGLAAVAIVVRQMLLIPFDRAEHWARTRWVKATTKAQGRSATAATPTAAVNDRLTLLRQYSEAQKHLSKGQRHLAFLSIDVVGSTAMKRDEDRFLIEHAFAEYRKFIDRILRANNFWKVAYTPDGTMACFSSEDDAVAAAQQVLSELTFFNEGVHKLKTPFSVRCGVNAGEVVFPETKTVEEITDFVIDLAGHMQKYAKPNALWLAKEILDGLKDKNGFRLVSTQTVDGRETYEWLPPVTAQIRASTAKAI